MNATTPRSEELSSFKIMFTPTGRPEKDKTNILYELVCAINLEEAMIGVQSTLFTVPSILENLVLPACREGIIDINGDQGFDDCYIIKQLICPLDYLEERLHTLFKFDAYHSTQLSSKSLGYILSSIFRTYTPEDGILEIISLISRFSQFDPNIINTDKLLESLSKRIQKKSLTSTCATDLINLLINLGLQCDRTRVSDQLGVDIESINLPITFKRAKPSSSSSSPSPPYKRKYHAFQDSDK